MRPPFSIFDLGFSIAGQASSRQLPFPEIENQKSTIENGKRMGVATMGVVATP
jgi:hypothetical protein